MPDIQPVDEARHAPDPAIELWNESYYLDWFAADGSLGGYVRIGFAPNLGTVLYWACLVEPGGPLITVVENEVPHPASPTTLEVRHDGLWADHVIEEPTERMVCHLESFGLSLEDPAAVYHDGYGDRVAFGFELEWETDRNGYQWPPFTPRYEIPCRVTGEVLVGDRRIEIDGWGQRDHSWGAARDWWTNRWHWSAGRLDDGTRWHTAGSFENLADGTTLEGFGVGYVLAPGSSTFEEYLEVSMDPVIGREGLVDHARLQVGGLDLHVEPLAWSPVLLVHPDGRRDRFPRALARFTHADGRTGHGWVEWNQPEL